MNEFIYLVLFIVIIGVLIGAIAYIVISIIRKNILEDLPSIKVQAVENLPLVVLFNNNNALNFIIDSGSTISYICEGYAEQLQIEKTQHYNFAVTGIGSTTVAEGNLHNVALTDTNRNSYNVNLYESAEFSETFKSIEDSINLKIHGILGTDFLIKYGCIINFESLEMYAKSK